MKSLRRGARTVAAAGAGVAVLMVLAPPSAEAAAPTAGSGHSVQLVDVNSADTNKVQVVFRYDGAASDISKLTLTENGKPTQPSAASTLADAKRDIGVVIVLDTSASTDNSGTLAESRNAIKALVPTLAKGTQVAVVAAGSDVLLAQSFTTDPALIAKATAALTPGGDGALWEGVARAASELKRQPNMIGSIVLITDGNNGKGASFSTAKGLAVDAGAAVFGVGVSGNLGSDSQELATATGGTFLVTDKAADATKLVTGFAPQLSGL